MAQPPRSAEAAAALAAETPRKPRRLRRIAGWFFSIVLCAGVAAGGWWFWRTRVTADVSAEAPQEETNVSKSGRKSSRRGSGVITLQPFVVNLADAGSARFLRVSMGLVVPSKGEAEDIERDTIAMMRVRSGILELLAQQTADTLVTPQGKDALKKTIAEQVEKALDGIEILDVLLTEFVVQF